MTKIEFFDPSGRTEVLHAYARRLDSLEGKTIGFLSNGQWQSFRALPLLKQAIETDFPGTRVLEPDLFPQGTEAISLDSTIALVLDSGVDAVIIGNAACGACSTACGLAAAKLERSGVPTITLTREDFVGVVRNSASGLGLPPDVPLVTFPIDLFLPDSDLGPLSERREEIYDRLTSWSTLLANETAPQVLSVEGLDYEDALEKLGNLLIANRWGDGLPVSAATRKRVDWILRGTDLARDHLLGRFPPRGGLATVESCAVALAMAGGRPEYLPVLIAAVEALFDERVNSAKMQATSGATFPVVIVNGPIGRDIRLGSGFGCMGPDPQHPAGAAIGRALRLMQQNLGGALPGTGTMAPWGAMRATNAVFAEDEDGLPEGWLPHGTERHGFARGVNSVSFFWATSAVNIVRRGAVKETRAQDVLEGLHRTAAYLATPNVHYTRSYADGTPGAIVLTRVVAEALAATGWDQRKVREFLWENSRIPQATLEKCGMRAWIEISPYAAARERLDLDPWPITSSPEDFILLVSGGGHPTHALWMPSFSTGVAGREIRVPRGFHDLLAAAAFDLGSGGEACMV